MTEPSSEAWKKMVLRSMPPPAWLQIDAPDGDVVVSSRFRVARNLVGYKFPHQADSEELRSIQKQVSEAAKSCPIQLETMGTLTEAERDYLLGSRLVSPEFEHRQIGRSLILDRERCISIMVNEEDHVRVQTLTAGWSSWTAEETGRQVLKHLENTLDFMIDEKLGPLPASPSNLGSGQRRSALFHLIGLATTKRLTRLLKGLGYMGITSRGLYGESSRAVGAFVQVSNTTGTSADFKGACNQIIKEERKARRDVSRQEIIERATQAVEYAIASSTMSLRDALLILGWVRWATSIDAEGFIAEPRAVDSWTATMEVYGTQDEKVASQHRAVFLRSRLESLK